MSERDIPSDDIRSDHFSDDEHEKHDESTVSVNGPRYGDTNERDIRAKQESSVASSAAIQNDDEIDADAISVLPGTGGPDDVGYMEVEPDDYDPTGHANERKS